ncbi:putative nicotinate-nucleotide pyrophosphorylase [carboxylating] [Virgibacillus kapii]|uniref:nicotinate-nucleotide diphosphorylase (carboxylating) n=2 Tax=Virgibacillus TaxID=84406 RepID=A0ABQ2DQR1_9BACI|nr:carboxylating nicotinate-nucleotide diphosphorylase [Virgibacillus massiliensis]EQB38967.1 hypothetical protein M948_01060 [Virgibacillus sp. CM-4]GGJ67584.1 putative nicotinate-nucleotide pyrophosphorylase [carboxylating] [Virgibacillus kapii]CDQ41091.1 putative nicotinate-nucleotide pyrophosphorylase [carboxylating] [Virgibacillus massiliensis]
MINNIKLKSMLESFFIEDIGDGDITTQYLFDSKQMGEMQLIAKSPGIFCGEEIINRGVPIINPMVHSQLFVKNGDKVVEGTEIARIHGPIKDLLQAERVVLNLIQRMSGIATLTAHAVDVITGTEARICDTRKTTPGLRMLEKHAVRCGGGFNHRLSLADAVMIKDNHIAYAGSITNAIRNLKNGLGHTIKIEVEIETEDQLVEAAANNVDIIMFDNCSPQTIKQWIHHVPNNITTEASGGITMDQLYNYATSGVDFISLGYLTHSASGLDISAQVRAENQMAK